MQDKNTSYTLFGLITLLLVAIALLVSAIVERVSKDNFPEDKDFTIAESAFTETEQTEALSMPEQNTFGEPVIQSFPQEPQTIIPLKATGNDEENKSQTDQTDSPTSDKCPNDRLLSDEELAEKITEIFIEVFPKVISKELGRLYTQQNKSHQIGSIEYAKLMLRTAPKEVKIDEKRVDELCKQAHELLRCNRRPQQYTNVPQNSLEK